MAINVAINGSGKSEIFGTLIATRLQCNKYKNKSRWIR